jgi:hypothetical protein
VLWPTEWHSWVQDGLIEEGGASLGDAVRAISGDASAVALRPLIVVFALRLLLVPGLMAIA